MINFFTPWSVSLWSASPWSATSRWQFRQIPTTTYMCADTEINQAICHALKTKVGDYIPPSYYHPHLMSLFHFGIYPHLFYERQYLYSDHHFVFAVDWYPYNPATIRRVGVVDRLILYFPGLGQSSDEKVSKQFAKQVARAGYICGIIVPRGHPSVSAHTLPKLWNPALTDDVHHVLQDLNKTYSVDGSKAKVFLVGLSGSTTLLTLYLASNHSKPFTSGNTDNHSVSIVGALCCCFCCDYRTTKMRLEQSLVGWIYSHFLTNKYKRLLHRNRHTMRLTEALANAPAVRNMLQKAQCLSQYDTVAYHLYGYRSEKEMEDAFTTTHRLADITVPVIFMQPADDPFYTLSHGSVRQGIPVDKLVQNQNLVYVEPSHGAHFGFADGPESYRHVPNTVMAVFDTICSQPIATKIPPIKSDESPVDL